MPNNNKYFDRNNCIKYNKNSVFKIYAKTDTEISFSV